MPSRRRLAQAIALTIALAAGLLLIFPISRKTDPGPGPMRTLDERSRTLESFRPSLNSREALARPSGLLFGIQDSRFPESFRGVEALERELGTAFPIIAFTVNWGDKPEESFPLDTLRTIHRAGSIPLISWEPWVTNFESTERNQLPPRGEREYRSLGAIARGSYDFYLTEWARQAAEFRHPILLRFAHAMNDPHRRPWGPQNGNRPEDFIAAWRHVRRIFDQAGADNVVWIWSPQTSIPFFESYYPGSEYVDWIGTQTLNYGPSAPWSRWWKLSEILQTPYQSLRRYEKPVIITDYGSVAAGGDVEDWHRTALRDLDSRFGGVAAVIILNGPDERLPELDWQMNDEPPAIEALAEAMLRHAAARRDNRD